MAEPPSGTITFLFTDIEGSTKRWQEQPTAMQTTLARHDALLGDAITASGGFVFKTVGDAFCAAFAEPTSAVAAAIAAQHALAAEPWGEIGPIRVRMALHTGVAELRDDDYFGQPVNRVARLLSTGAGGQTLLSAATQELLRDHLPGDVGLQDLGEHRLKDLTRPERIYQLLAPGLATDFPPLKTLDHRPNNLPLQLTPFVGRDRDVAAVADLVTRDHVRLVTLIGPGGTGKTRLSLQVAAELLTHVPDGVFFVPLEPVVDPDLVPDTIAQTLGLRESGEQSIVEQLIAHLRTKELLLVLDNFEHVTDAAPMVTALLQGCPTLTVLVTSRHALRVRGEREYPVSPLELPDPAHLPPLEHLTQYEAVRLFIERAQAVQPAFEVTNDNAPAVAEICHRLDGLPLAIELAAARTKLLPPQALLNRLDNRLTLLTGGSRDVTARQQTLRGAIAWSHELLSDEEQALFRQLAVFAGGFTFEAAETVVGGDVFDGIASLVDKSLVRQTNDANGEPRFAMLQTIRDFGLEQLASNGESETLAHRHAWHFLAIAEESNQALTGPSQAKWLDALDADHDNLRAALTWTERQADREALLRLASALDRFWMGRGHLKEGRQWLDRAHASSDAAPPALRAKVLNAAGQIAELQGDLIRSAALHEAALVVWRQLDDQKGIAASLHCLGNVAINQGDYELAMSRNEEAHAIYDRLGDKRGMASSLCGAGNVALYQGDYDRAVAIYEESLALARQVGDHASVALLLGNLGFAAGSQGDHQRAAAFYEENLALSRELGDKYSLAAALIGLVNVSLDVDLLERARALCEEALPMIEEMGDRRMQAVALNNLATIADKEGDATKAIRLFQESLTLFDQIGDQEGVAATLDDLAATLGEQGKPERASRLLGASDAIRLTIGAPRTPSQEHSFARGTAAARAAFGDDGLAALMVAGQALTPAQALAEALAETTTVHSDQT